LVGLLSNPILLVFVEPIKRGLHLAQHVFEQIDQGPLPSPVTLDGPVYLLDQLHASLGLGVAVAVAVGGAAAARVDEGASAPLRIRAVSR
jgi:hypothetical protein